MQCKSFWIKTSAKCININEVNKYFQQCHYVWGVTPHYILQTELILPCAKK